VELYQQRNKLKIFKELLELGVDCSKPILAKNGTFIYSLDVSNLTEDEIQKAIELLDEYKNMEYTKGQKMAVMEYKELSKETKDKLQNVKQLTADLIDLAELYKTSNNGREIAMAQTNYELAVMMLTKRNY